MMKMKKERFQELGITAPISANRPINSALISSKIQCCCSMLNVSMYSKSETHAPVVMPIKIPPNEGLRYETIARIRPNNRPEMLAIQPTYLDQNIRKQQNKPHPQAFLTRWL